MAPRRAPKRQKRDEVAENQEDKSESNEDASGNGRPKGEDQKDDKLDAEKQEEKAAKVGEDDEPRPYEDANYWEGRYARETTENETDEWGFSYEELEPLLAPLRPRQRAKDDEKPPIVVDLGCGVSEMLFDMAEDGWDTCKLLGVDLAASAAKTMQTKARERELHASVSFEQLDLTKLTDRFEKDSVDMYIDKMTMDAILHAPDGENIAVGILQQVAFTLQPGGSFLLVTQMHPDKDLTFHERIIEALSERDKESPSIWQINLHLSTDESVGLHVYIFTKQKRHQMARRSGDRGPKFIYKVHHH
ncbi:Methyltransferase-like protein 12, mitochondrial [Hondaea fermentalgiana]|uniref:Methyltransferase-like protein 12, mitochondrial n=1 Tax=Hondaea fermentalgiana TaxID=2315210 RepID=A0A2R5GI35_9STRA|nr:Methyltransferase-like protein 12, mitochondrial [Hondaea fermentalgiana]|eukprot:GBG27951.1 Methyltransferase-like protein 12, mitochondrial [Hondaea fermentalgiana]